MSYYNKYFLCAESDRNQLQVSDRQQLTRFVPGNYTVYFMTHFSNLTSIFMSKAYGADFKYISEQVEKHTSTTYCIFQNLYHYS